MATAREAYGTPSDEELHVLAVDDSYVDRKVIERLLKVSACKGMCFCLFGFMGGERWKMLWRSWLNLDSCSDDRGKWNKSSAISGIGWKEELCWFWCKLICLQIATFCAWLMRKWNSTKVFIFWFFLMIFCWLMALDPGSESESYNDRLLHAWDDWLWTAQKDQSEPFRPFPLLSPGILQGHCIFMPRFISKPSILICHLLYIWAGIISFQRNPSCDNVIWEHTHSYWQV